VVKLYGDADHEQPLTVSDTDGLGYLLRAIIPSCSFCPESLPRVILSYVLMETMDKDGNGRIDFKEFVVFMTDAESIKQRENKRIPTINHRLSLKGSRLGAFQPKNGQALNKMLVVLQGSGHVGSVLLNRSTQQRGGRPKARTLVDELIETSLVEQVRVFKLSRAGIFSLAFVCEFQFSAAYQAVLLSSIPNACHF
jgi:hypothetical protein